MVLFEGRSRDVSEGSKGLWDVLEVFQRGLRAFQGCFKDFKSVT